MSLYWFVPSCLNVDFALEGPASAVTACPARAQRLLELCARGSRIPRLRASAAHVIIHQAFFVCRSQHAHKSVVSSQAVLVCLASMLFLQNELVLDTAVGYRLEVGLEPPE